MHASAATAPRITPGWCVVELNDTAGDPGGGELAQSFARIAIGREQAELCDGTFYGAAQRILKQAAELHQRGAKLGVVAGGELCQEPRGENNRDRLVFTEAQLRQEPLLRHAPSTEVVPHRHTNTRFERLQVAVGGAATDAELLGEIFRSDPRLAGGFDIAQGAQQAGAAVALLEVGVALR